MNKGTITIELPILDDVDQMEVVKTFNEKQLWYVCAIAKAFEKSQQELQRKDNIINGIKEELNKNYNTYVCKNKSYGKTFKAGAEVYKEHLLYKIKKLEGEVND